MVVYSFYQTKYASARDENFFRSIRKDKDGIWTCLLAAARTIFNKYLKVASERNLDSTHERQLELHAQFLLIMFNHNLKEVRIVVLLTTNVHFFGNIAGEEMCRYLPYQFNWQLSAFTLEWQRY